MGIFIKVEINKEKCTPEIGKKLVEICPVNIFSIINERVVTDSENEDECTLCELCLNICPECAVKVRRLYIEK